MSHTCEQGPSRSLAIRHNGVINPLGVQGIERWKRCNRWPVIHLTLVIARALRRGKIEQHSERARNSPLRRLVPHAAKEPAGAARGIASSTEIDVTVWLGFGQWKAPTSMSPGRMLVGGP